jgi:glucosamine 6-phosphate synthetase-like amidotransferase/phosphosugar isomerase protein
MIMTEFLDNCYKAIKLQATSIPETLSKVDRKERYTIDDKNLVVFTGCGDSYGVAEYGKWAFLSAGVNAVSLSPPELSRIHLYDNVLVVGISASGRSLATIDALNHAKSEGATTVALTDNPEGAVAQIVDHLWLTYSGVDSYNISPSSPTTTAMAYLLKLTMMIESMPHSRIREDSVRLGQDRVSKDMVIWAESVGQEIVQIVDPRKPLFLISDGPNYVAAQIGAMKFNEFSLIKGVSAIREEFQHHYVLSINDNDRAILITDNPREPNDKQYLKVLTRTLKMRAYHLHTPERLNLISSLEQAIANTIALQMASYYTVLEFDSEKMRFKLPHAQAFKIY